MGNKSIYSIVDEDEIINKPLSNNTPIYLKGLPYEIILKHKLKGRNWLEWTYFFIYDLRNGKITWKLLVNVYGDKLEFKLYVVNSKEDITAPITDLSTTIPLYCSKSSTNYMTKLKGSKDGKNVELELYPDNIHCYTLQKCNIEYKLIIYGFIKLDDQSKIPIAF